MFIPTTAQQFDNTASLLHVPAFFSAIVRELTFILTFRGPCIVIHSYKKRPTRCIISQRYFDRELYMFRTDFLSIIRSLITVFAAIGICHASYADCLLARSFWPRQQTFNITSMTNTYCCEYSNKTPDDGQKICPKHVEFSQNKVEK